MARCGVSERCRVFIVEHDPDALEMMRAIVEFDVGCEVAGSLATDQGNLDRIKAFNPNLIILDLVIGHTENWRLLDQLRADVATSSIPVLALSTLDVVVEQSLASYNVQEVLTKPFDLDEFERAIRDLLSRPKVTVPTVPERPGGETLREAADILAVDAREIILDWMRRVSQIEPFRSQRRLRPRQLLSRVPVLLWGTTVALRTGAYEHLFAEQSVFRGSAVEHARARREQGLSLGALIREYELLRDAIWQRLEDKAPKGKWTADDVFHIGRIVNRSLDEIVAIAVQSYEQAQAGKAT